MQNDLFGGVRKPTKLHKLRIPFLGSKNVIAEKLLDKMLEVKPNAKYFVDLTAGGGSMSFTALQYGMQVVYNERQTSLANFVKYLVERIRSGERSEYGLFPKEWYNFVSREEFHKQKVLETPYAQFVKICYSFANNQKDYIFGVSIERQKELIHNICVFRCEKSLQELNETFGTHYTISNKKTPYLRMLAYKTEWNTHIKENECFREMIETGFIKNHCECTSLKKKEWLQKQEIVENLERVKKLEDLESLEQIQSLKECEKLESIRLLENGKRIVNIETLETLETLERLTILNQDFINVKITTPHDETIVFIDPPYRQTAKYIEDCSPDIVDDYFRNSPYSVFLSEYDAPFEPILEIPKMKLMNNVNLDKRKYVMEKLFWNGK
jgi:16S rRNA G966 N2-methylase RsmD